MEKTTYKWSFLVCSLFLGEDEPAGTVTHREEMQ
jgi:hypothetical protein